MHLAAAPCVVEFMSSSFAEEISEAERTDMLHLPYFGLLQVPVDIFALKSLVRLDLGFNQIIRLPSEIGMLGNLGELWLNNNPLASIPAAVQFCRKLKVLDVRETRIKTLPMELGRLQHLVRIDARGVAFEGNGAVLATAVGTHGVLAVLQEWDRTNALKMQLMTTLLDENYREIADDPAAVDDVRRLVEGVFIVCVTEEERHSMIRHAGRLFRAKHPRDADPRRIRATYIQLKLQNQRKKMRAELELKLRAIYFDQIRIEAVEGVIEGIYGVVDSLDDIMFLIKHAKVLFPADPETIVASKVAIALERLQNEMAAERQAAIDGLAQALLQIYSDTDPNLVKGLAESVGVLFRKVESIKKLAADAPTYFPVEFSSAEPKLIRAAFAQA